MAKVRRAFRPSWAWWRGVNCGTSPPRSISATWGRLLATALRSWRVIARDNTRSESTTNSGCALSGRRKARRMSTSWTTTKEDATMAKKLKPMHPGEVLREEFLVPLGMSAGALAKTCGLPRTRIERIASEQTGITADTALRLAKALGTTAQLWLNLQTD